MAKNFINGYSTPRFLIIQDNSLINTIDLDLTDTDGLMEDYEFYSINHQLIDFTNLQTIRGYHINFSLSYKSYSKKTNSMKIKKLIDYYLSNEYQIFLTPRVDFLINNYEVVLTNNSIQLGILKNGINAVGNRGINLEFKTKYLQTEMHWYDPDDIYITIEDFVTTN